MAEMVAPTRITNGIAPKPRPRVAALELAKHEKVEMYHGIPVLDMHVDDPIPTPRAPIRYALRLYPDLSRYLLTFNHPRNRNPRKSWWQKLARDMAAGRWRFHPRTGPVFSVSGVLQDGQHTLMANIEAGATDTWVVIDLGWPDEIITSIDQVARRNPGDALRVGGVTNNRNIQTVIALVERYDFVMRNDRRRGFNGLGAPTNDETIALYAASPDEWDAAFRAGERTYKALEHGLSTSYWAAAHRIISRVYDVAEADAFLREVAEGTGQPKSATRTLGEFYRRRGATFTVTVDTREPLENIIRGFNAWGKGKSVSLVNRAGFELSAVR